MGASVKPREAQHRKHLKHEHVPMPLTDSQGVTNDEMRWSHNNEQKWHKRPATTIESPARSWRFHRWRSGQRIFFLSSCSNQHMHNCNLQHPCTKCTNCSNKQQREMTQPGQRSFTKTNKCHQQRSTPHKYEQTKNNSIKTTQKRLHQRHLHQPILCHGKDLCPHNTVLPLLITVDKCLCVRHVPPARVSSTNLAGNKFPARTEKYVDDGVRDYWLTAPLCRPTPHNKCFFSLRTHTNVDSVVCWPKNNK